MKFFYSIIDKASNVFMFFLSYKAIFKRKNSVLVNLKNEKKIKKNNKKENPDTIYPFW